MDEQGPMKFEPEPEQADVTGLREALTNLLRTPCDCPPDYTERGRHAPDCRYQFIHDYLDDAEIDTILAATPPAPPATAVLREAGDGYEVQTWVRHEPSGVVVLKGHPQLGGRYCRTDGGDWPCAAVREALEAAPQPASEAPEPDQPR